MDPQAIAILHLSDMHFTHESNPVTARASAAVAALRAEAPQLRACVLAISGDVAHSGQREEYEHALAFFESLKAHLEATYPSALFYFVAIPGNHDCDFSGSSELRELTIDNLGSRLESLDPTGEIARLCLAVQANFYAFLTRLYKIDVPLSEWLYSERELKVDDYTIRFQCHNSAWVSRLPERQGQLLYPISVASVKDSPARDVAAAISILHHPFNWYSSVNSRSFREFIERTSDLVLTGHEHVAGSYNRESHTDARLDYLEGAVLQDKRDAKDSGFNIVLLDLPARQYLHSSHKWTGERYERAHGREWAPFKRNPLLAQHAFENSQEHLLSLTDPGTAFSHPRRQSLALSDLYVYPDLSRQAFVQSGKEDPTRTRIPSGELLDVLADKGDVVITGAANSGKTSLAKTLYLDLKRRKGVVPLMLNGAELKGTRGSDFRKVCASAFGQQYHARQLPRYEQLERSQRLIIIDDFEEARFTERNLKEIMSAANAHAASIIVMADDVFMIGLLSHSRQATRAVFGEFELYTIREFGYALRSKLVEKWHRLGFEITEPETDLQHQIDVCEKMLNTLIGKNLVPSYPLTILTLLQTMEAATKPSTASGSYGYLYEALITAALARVSHRAADLDTKYTYLSRLAYKMYEDDVQRLSREQLEEVTEKYFSMFRLRFPVAQVLRELAEARILDEAHGFYNFKYKYIYCYFVARYLRDNAAGALGQSVRATLHQMADRVHFEDHTNILILYLYLTRDPELIGYLLDCARRIYSDYAPCDFEGDVSFVNTLYTDTRPLVLPPGEPADHRELERERLDSEAAQEEAELHGEAKQIAYGDELTHLLKMNFSVKTLHVLGQVLRNFPGSLERDVKLEIAKESYLLGLRSLKAVLGIAENNLEELRIYFARLIREQRSISGVAELAQSTDELLIWLTLGCAFGIVKRISTAVGLQELSGTYADVLEVLGPTLSAKLIDVAIRLDHFDAVPLDQIEGVARVVTKNLFTRRVLRDLVANHLYLFQVDYRAKQALGELLEIRTTDVRFLDNPSKKER